MSLSLCTDALVLEQVLSQWRRPAHPNKPRLLMAVTLFYL
jgi:hypothetical protein